MEASQAPSQSQSQPSNDGQVGNQEVQQPEVNANVRKIKLNGEEREVSIDDVKRHLQIDDFDPKYEKAILQAYQKSIGADHAFNEVNLTKKQIEAQRKQIELYNELLVKEPDTLLEELLDANKLDEIAFKRIQKRFELEQMTPDQREAYEAKLERDREKNQRQEYEQKLQQFEHEQQVNFHIQNESKAMIDAIQRSALPKDKQTLQLTATYMLAGYSAEEAVATIENRLPSLVDLWIQSATPEQINKLLSKKAREKMQSYTVGQVSRKPQNQAPPPGSVPRPRDPNDQPDYKTRRRDRLEAAFSGFIG